jgi:hypothetical protein
MKNTKIVIAATMALTLLPICSAVAAETPAAVEDGLKVQLDEMTCAEMLIQSGKERDFTMIYFHGVINGLQKDFLFDAVKVSEATDMIYTMCIADTNANLLEVFKKARS